MLIFLRWRLPLNIVARLMHENIYWTNEQEKHTRNNSNRFSLKNAIYFVFHSWRQLKIHEPLQRGVSLWFIHLVVLFNICVLAIDGDTESEQIPFHCNRFSLSRALPVHLLNCLNCLICHFSFLNFFSLALKCFRFGWMVNVSICFL